MDEELTGILIAVAVVVAVVVAFVLVLVPEPSDRAVVAADRLDVAVLAFGNSSAWPGVGETLRARVETKLVNTEGVSVFSRTRLDALLTEQALGQAGALDSRTAARIGSLTGANKLVTGAAYGVDISSESVTVCEQWKDGACIQSTPATRYTVKLLAQVEVLDAQTGRIEQAQDEEGTASVTVKQGEVFPGYEALIATAADEVASGASALLTLTYTREIRYGLYKAAKPKSDGFVGEGETTRFRRADGTACLIVHFTRVRDGDAFDLTWVDSSGAVVSSSQDVVKSDDWRLYSLDLGTAPLGRITAAGRIGGIDAFAKAFVVSP